MAEKSYDSRSMSPRCSRWRRVDPGLNELRAAAVVMVAALASYGSALALEHVAHLHVDVVVLAVVLAVTLGRTQRGSGPRTRLVGIVALPVVAMGASEVGALMSEHATIGDALFVAAVSFLIWIRRFGPAFAKVGTLATLPFIATLITPIPPVSGGAHTLWTAVVAVITITWVSAVQLLAERIGVTAPAAAPPRAAGAAPAPTTTRRGSARLPASTRMAVQMGVALATAFAAGWWLFPTHWAWVVLTAYIVCSGNRGRGDVLHKSLLRVVGAAIGVIVATALAGTFAPGDTASIVAIFILATATWLRAVNYAYWAGCITAALALLYGYFGETGTSLLWTRLEGILLGALIGTAASWLILPIKTADVLRRRTADALAILTEVLGAVRTDPARLAHHQARFEHAVAPLNQIAGSLEAHRRLVRTWRTRPHHADTVDVLRSCARPVRTIVQCAAARPDVLVRPEIARRGASVLTKVVALRRAMAGRGDAGDRPLPTRQDHPHTPEPDDDRTSPSGHVETALAQLDAAVTSLAALLT